MEKTFIIEGMSCGHCVMAVKKELSKANISDYKLEIGKIVIDLEKNSRTIEELTKAIEEAGYKVISN